MTIGCWIETKDSEIHISAKDWKTNENVKRCGQIEQFPNDAKMKTSIIIKTIALNSCSTKAWRNWEIMTSKETRALNSRLNFDRKTRKETKRSTKVCKVRRWKC